MFEIKKSGLFASSCKLLNMPLKAVEGRSKTMEGRWRPFDYNGRRSKTMEGRYVTLKLVLKIPGGAVHRKCIHFLIQRDYTRHESQVWGHRTAFHCLGPPSIVIERPSTAFHCFRTAFNGLQWHIQYFATTRARMRLSCIFCYFKLR